MKKIILLFLITTFFIPNVYAMGDETRINLNNIKISKEEYEKFKKMGYTDEVIYNIDQDLYDRITKFEYLDSSDTSEYYEDIYIQAN